jgi:hypothetical protein
VKGKRKERKGRKGKRKGRGKRSKRKKKRKKKKIIVRSVSKKRLMKSMKVNKMMMVSSIVMV